MPLIAELKRRNVFKVGAAYMALAWVIVQITGAVVPALNLPPTLIPMVVWIGVIGFPCVLIFSWIYELTPEGLKRESEIDRGQSITHITSKRLDYLTIALLVVAIGLFLLQYLRPPVATTVAQAPAAEAVPALAAPAAAQSTPIAAPDDKSIAVLPFTDMSAEKNQDYMSDGIAEELLNLLAKVPELQVASRSSAFTFKGKDVEIPEIARRLHVAHILEGSVRKAGNRIRITAQLIDGRTDKHLWSETYDRSLDDIFAVQDEIAGAVVTQLKIKLLGAAPRAKEANPEAYALFLQARQLRRQTTREGFEQSIALDQQALAIDPNFATAWRELYAVYVTQAGNGLRPVDEAYKLGREAIERALAIDPDFALAHDGLGWISMTYDGDLAAAAQHYRHALELEPTNEIVIANSGTLAGNLGRLDTAISVYLWSISHDPLNTIAQVNLGFTYISAGKFDEAIACLRTGLHLAPGFIGAQASIGQALLLKGDAEAALVEVGKEGDEINRLFVLAMVLHTLGRHAESDAALNELIGKHGNEAAYAIAEVYAWRNEVDHAFEWLDKSVVLHDASLAAVPFDPMMAKLKQDPRWLAFLRKLGKAPEQLAAIPFDVKLPN